MSPKQFPLSLNPRWQLQKPLKCIHLAGFAAVFPLTALCYLYKLTYPQAETSKMLRLVAKGETNTASGASLHAPSFQHRAPAPLTGMLRAAGGMGGRPLPAVVGMTQAARVGGNGLAALFPCTCVIFKI